MELESVLSPPRPRLPAPALAGPLASDERLAKLVGRGDETAFLELYKRYHPSLYRYCRSLLRNDADAEDALQCTFVAALQSLQREQRDVSVRPWLFRIAHNESISLIRRRRPEQRLPNGYEAGTAPLEEEVVERERLALLVADLRALTERQRAALLMRELSGLSHKDIAVALGITVHAAKQSIFEARRSLQEFTEGRAMDCEQVRRMISDADGRMLRSRRVRAHARHCPQCSAFAAAIGDRSRHLQVLVPGLPPAAAAGLLARSALGGSLGARDAAGMAAGVGKTVGGGLGLVMKATAVTAATAVVAVGTSIELSHILNHQPGRRGANPSMRLTRGVIGQRPSGGRGPGTGRVADAGARTYGNGVRAAARVETGHGLIRIGVRPAHQRARETTTGPTGRTGGWRDTGGQSGKTGGPTNSTGQTGSDASSASSSQTGKYSEGKGNKGDGGQGGKGDGVQGGKGDGVQGNKGDGGQGSSGARGNDPAHRSLANSRGVSAQPTDAASRGSSPPPATTVAAAQGNSQGGASSPCGQPSPGCSAHVPGHGVSGPGSGK